jgi:LacI family transcriptional regulator
LKAASIPFDEELLKVGDTKKHGGFSEEAGYEAMQELLTKAPDVTAIFASSDVQAIGAWKALRDAGKRVPEDVAIVGYDDIKTSRYIGLTSVDQSMDEVGQEATELLIRRLDGDRSDHPSSILVNPKLNVRSSSNFSRESAG